MKLQDQVCTWEQGLRLHELGVEKDKSYFTWVECILHHKGGKEEKWWAIFRPNDGVHDYASDMTFPDWCTDDEEFETARECCAFTVAELGVMIPDYIVVDNYRMHFQSYKQEQRDNGKLFTATFGRCEDQEIPDFDNSNEAIARTDLLIFILKNNLTTPEEVNQRLNNG